MTDAGALNPFTRYLQEIGATDVLQARVERSLRSYKRLVGAEPETIHISEQASDDSSRIYESLWIFSADTASEVSLVGDDFMIDEVSLVDNVARWELRLRDYDLDVATPASRCTVEITFRDDEVGYLNASGKNCEWLVALIRGRIAPRLRNEAQLKREGPTDGKE